MNRIVRERYPADRLPEDLRDQIGDATEVRVTVEAEPVPPRAVESLAAFFDELDRLKREGKIASLTREEIDARIQELRGE